MEALSQYPVDAGRCSVVFIVDFEQVFIDR